MGSTCACDFRESTLADILIVHRIAQIDYALALKQTHGGNDLLLCRLDLLEFDGTQSIHVLFQHVRSTLRHHLQKVLSKLFTGALQRHREHLAIDASQQFPDAACIDPQKVLEHKHQVANGFAELRVSSFDRVEDFLRGALIEAIEHLGNCADTTVGLAACLSESTELLSDNARDLRNDLRRDLIEIRD